MNKTKRKRGAKPKPLSVRGLCPLTLLKELEHKGKLILPVPAHLITQRFQANIKAVQSKSKGGLHLQTEKVFYFSASHPEDGVYEAVAVVVTRNVVAGQEKGMV